MKTLTIRQVAAIKRVAKNVNPLVVKKNKLAVQITKLNKEYNDLIDEIEGHEMGVKALTGGMVSEDLITKKVEDTGKVDKNGNPIKITKYEPREDVLIFHKEDNVYEIKEEESETLDSVMPESVDDTETAPESEI